MPGPRLLIGGASTDAIGSEIVQCLADDTDGCYAKIFRTALRKQDSHIAVYFLQNGEMPDIRQLTGDE